MRRGDREGYQEACEMIKMDGPYAHRIGSTIEHGRWNAEGEWCEETFRVTLETFNTILKQTGLPPITERWVLDEAMNDVVRSRRPQDKIPGEKITAETTPGEPLLIHGALPRTIDPQFPTTHQQARQEEPEEGHETEPDDQPVIQEHQANAESLQARLTAIQGLLEITGLDEKTRAESIAMQVQFALTTVLEVQDQSQSLREISEENSRMIMNPGRTESPDGYLEKIPGWLELIQNAGNYTVELPSRAHLFVQTRGPGGQAECTVLPGETAACPWPECLAADPRKCSYSGRRWQECRLPGQNERQARTKFMMNKHEEMFPWPPEWDEELQAMGTG